MKPFTSVILVCLFAFMGGVFSDQYLKQAMATDPTYKNERQGVRYLDAEGRPRVDIGVMNGQPLQDLYGADGKLRLQFGTYGGSVSAAEKGLPNFTMYDNSGKLRLLFRLAGPNQAPVLILKDKSGRDRLILGLDLWDAKEPAFLVVFDENGRKHDIVGSFAMKPL